MPVNDLSGFDHSPVTDDCERSGGAPDRDLRLVIFKGRDRYAERTLCDLCAEEAFEAFINTVSAKPAP